VRKDAVHIDPLADRSVSLELELFRTEFRLPDQDQGQRALRIDLCVQEEAQLLQCLLVEQVCLIQDTYDIFVLKSADQLDLFLKFQLRVTAVELLRASKLLDEPVVKPFGSKL
jgi:hypothetical protein